MALGGRAAEQVFFGKVSTGASDDLKRVTNMVYSMIQVYGFGQSVGQLSFQSDDPSRGKPFSEATSRAMDEEAKELVDSAYRRTVDVRSVYFDNYSRYVSVYFSFLAFSSF